MRLFFSEPRVDWTNCALGDRADEWWTTYTQDLNNKSSEDQIIGRIIRNDGILLGIVIERRESKNVNT